MSLKNTSFFNPTLISGCSLWLDGADSSTISLSGSTVTQWNDKSRNGYNTTSYGGTPTLQANAINGVQSISFNGSSYLTGNNSNTGSTATFFLVATLTSGQGAGQQYTNAYAFSRGSGVPMTDYNEVFSITGLACQNSGPSLALSPQRNGANGPTFTPPNYNSAFIHTTVLDGTNMYGYGNGTSVGSTSSSGNFAYVIYSIGSQTYANTGPSYPVSFNYFWTGYIGELIAFNTNLSTTQRQQIEGYLAWKWRLTSSLPFSHPYALVPSYGLPSLVPNAPAKTSLTYANHPVIAAGGCALWLDASDSSTITLSGSTITQWRDKSINGYAMIQNQGITTVSAGTLNSLNAVYVPSSTNLKMLNFLLRTNFTTFIVGKAAAGNLLIGGNTFGTSGISFYEFTGNSDLLAIPSASSGSTYLDVYDTGGVPVSPNTWFIFCIGYNNVNSSTASPYRVNGIARTTAAGGGSSAIPDISYSGILYLNSLNGTNSYDSSFFAEVLHYNYSMNTTQCQNIEGYLAQKWGLTANLPAGHPYKSTFPLYPSAITTGVRRIAGRRWSPLTPGGCGLWLDASDISTLFQDSAGTIAVTSSGQPIGLWRDKSGLARDFSQASSGNRVSYDTSSKGALQLSSPTYLQASAASLGTVSTSANLTIIMTASTGPSASWQIILAQWFTGTTRFHLSFQSGTDLTPTLYSASSGTQLPYPMSGTMAYNRTYTIGFIANGTSLYMSFMGTSNTTTMSAALSTNPSSALTIADSRNGNLTDGKIQEIIIYPSAISTTAFQQAEGYLAWKWGLKASLPSSHPYKLFPPSP